MKKLLPLFLFFALFTHPLSAQLISVLPFKTIKKISASQEKEQINVKDQIELGAALSDQKKYEEAKAAFLKGLEGQNLSNVDTLTLYMNLGKCEKELGNLDKAISYHKEALNVPLVSDKGKAMLYANIASIQIEKKDWKAALDSSNSGLALEKLDPTANSIIVLLYGYRAEALYHLNQIEAAAKNYQDALELNGLSSDDRASIYIYYAQYYIHLKNYTAAQEKCTTALALKNLSNEKKNEIGSVLFELTGMQRVKEPSGINKVLLISLIIVGLVTLYVAISLLIFYFTGRRK